MRSRTSAGALLARHLPTGAATSVLVAILIGAAVFAATAAPRAMQALGTAELRYELEQLPVHRLDVLGSGRLGYAASPSEFVTMLERTDDSIQKLRDQFESPVADGLGQPTWLVRTAAFTGELADTSVLVPVFRFAVELGWEERVTFESGAAPGDWVGDDGDDATPVEPVPIALSSDAAEQLSVGVGDVIRFDEAPVVVAGIYSPTDPGARYWQQERDLGEGISVLESGSPPKVQASVYVSSATAGRLRDLFATGGLSMYIPVDPQAYRYVDVGELGLQLRQAQATPLTLPEQGELQLRSDTSDVLDVVVGRVTSTASLLGLAVSGLVGLLLAVFAMCVAAVIARRRTALALAAARGASPLQWRITMVVEGLLIAIPVSVVAYFAAVLLFPEPVGLEANVLPAAVALAVPVLFAVLTSASRVRGERNDLSARSSSPVRWILEVAVVGLAITSVVLLQRRGLVSSSEAVGVDPLLVAAPLLIAAAVSVVVLRLYPLPLRRLQAVLGRGSSSTALVGAARAVRSPIVGFAAVLALLVGMSVVVFSLGMVTTVREGLERGASDTVGADVQVQAHDLPVELVDSIELVDGVAAAVSVIAESGVTFSDEIGPTQVTVVLADTAALHAVRPDLPVLADSGAAPMPVFVSSDWLDRIEGDELELVNSRVEIAGTVEPDALPGLSRRWILVDERAADELGLGDLPPDRLLVAIAPAAQDATVTAAIRDVVSAAQPDPFVDAISVRSAAELLQEIQRAPTVGGLQVALLVTVAASLLLTLITVVLASVGAATSRNKAVGLLSILGMTSRQIRALIAWELGPVSIVAAVVGTGLGLVLPLIVTSVLDLRDFLGGSTPPGAHIDPVLVAIAVAVFAVVVVLAGVLASALGRRFAPAGTLKMGEA